MSNSSYLHFNRTMVFHLDSPFHPKLRVVLEIPETGSCFVAIGLLILLAVRTMAAEKIIEDAYSC